MPRFVDTAGGGPGVVVKHPAPLIVARHTCRSCRHWDPQEGTVDTAYSGLCTNLASGVLLMHREGGCTFWRLNEDAWELVCRRRKAEGRSQETEDGP